jgi:hypothetical protein
MIPLWVRLVVVLIIIVLFAAWAWFNLVYVGI